MKLTQVVNLSRVPPHKLETNGFCVAGSAERATSMSQSNNSTAPCVNKGGHGKATTSVCDARSGAGLQKKINLAMVTIVASPKEKRKRNSWGVVWKVMQ